MNSNCTRRDTAGSFWRTSSSGNSGELAGPCFSSMSMKQRHDSTASLERRNSGKVGVALQMQQFQFPEQADESNVSVNVSVSVSVSVSVTHTSEARCVLTGSFRTCASPVNPAIVVSFGN